MVFIAIWSKIGLGKSTPVHNDCSYAIGLGLDEESVQHLDI